MVKFVIQQIHGWCSNVDIHLFFFNVKNGFFLNNKYEAGISRGDG